MQNISDDSKIHIVKMNNRHLNEITRLAQISNLSYWSREDYQTEIDRADSLCLVAEGNHKEFKGFLIARLITPEGYAEINNIAVETEFRRLKIGKNLLNSLVNVCKINNLTKILLEVRESNKTAIEFYLRNDFKTLVQRNNFYRNPLENGLTMIKYLI